MSNRYETRVFQTATNNKPNQLTNVEQQFSKLNLENSNNSNFIDSQMSTSSIKSHHQTERIATSSMVTKKIEMKSSSSISKK